MRDLIFDAVYSPDELIEGYTQSKLNGLWWKNFLELAEEENTLFRDDSNIADHPYNKDADPSNDVTLTDLAQKNQLDGIQFLAGIQGELGVPPPGGTYPVFAERTVTIDPESILFFPLLNTVWTPREGEVQGYPVPDFDLVESGLNGIFDVVNKDSLVTSINGIEIPDIADYEQFALEEDGFTIEPGGYAYPDENGPIVGPTYAAGYYVGISPLPPELEGHTINFQGAIKDLNGDGVPEFALDVTYNIYYEFNEVLGTNRKDKNLLGTDKSDHIQGLDGKDTILGLSGNDNISGGNGPDTLTGVDPTSERPGEGEIDILEGGRGSDTYVLGDKEHVYYVGEELRDYAIIRGFRREDIIQLNGDSHYELDSSLTLFGKEGTGIFLEDTDELIGFVEGTTNLSLIPNAHDFIFV